MKQLISHIESPKERDHFYIQFLIIVLTLIMVLITAVFLIMYSTLSRQTLNTYYNNEQENIINVSYSATIMNDAATSFLEQLNKNPHIKKLIYTEDFGNISSINAMISFKNYSTASDWIDSAYIYNAKIDTVIYLYSSNTETKLSFRSSDEFWDKDFLQYIKKPENYSQTPALRDITVPHSDSKQVFSYYSVVKSNSTSYDGIYVINIRADYLMELCQGITKTMTRQFIIAEDTNNYYTYESSLLSEDGLKELLDTIHSSDTNTRQSSIRGIDGQKVLCTWNNCTDFPFTFISCVPASSITSHLKTIRMWLVIFYCSVLTITVLSFLVLNSRFRAEYIKLQNRYDQEAKRYQNNYRYVNDMLLRNFLTSKDKEDFAVIAELFKENNIELESYRCYSLLLLEVLDNSTICVWEHATGTARRATIQNILAHTIPSKYRYEVCDVLQNRHILIIECDDQTVMSGITQKIHTLMTEKFKYNVSGIFTIGVPSLFDLPIEYQILSQEFELLYFYPTVHFMDSSNLQKRNFFGHNAVDSLCDSVIYELKSQHFDEASTLLSSFFDNWFEPISSVNCTLDHMIKVFSDFIQAFTVAHAMKINFDRRAFENNIYHCEYAQNTKLVFLNLIEDIRLVFESSSKRNKYVDMVLSLIHKNYADANLNIEYIAEQAGLSVSHVKSVFKAETGITVSKYLRHYRLEKASELLTDSDIPINLISEQTGFGNQSYFYTVFKKYYSCTPNEYRNSFSKGNTA